MNSLETKFKSHSLEEKVKTSNLLLQKYPDCIPLILTSEDIEIS